MNSPRIEQIKHTDTIWAKIFISILCLYVILSILVLILGKPSIVGKPMDSDGIKIMIN